MNNDTNKFTLHDRLATEPMRMWVNQGSTLQTFNKYHGCNVLTVPPIMKASNNVEYIRVYFTSGDIIAMDMALNALSKGWK